MKVLVYIAFSILHFTGSFCMNLGVQTTSCDLSSKVLTDCTAQIVSTWTVNSDKQFSNVQLYCKGTDEEDCIRVAPNIKLDIKDTTITGLNKNTCIKLDESAGLTLDKVTLTGCGDGSLTQGGGISCEGGNNVLIDGSTIMFNEGLVGAGIFAQSSSTVVVRNSEFKDNIAKDKAGAIYIANSEGNIRNTIFRGNIADVGGAMVVETSSFRVAKTTITGNVGNIKGDGIYCDSGEEAAALDMHIDRNSHKEADEIYIENRGKSNNYECNLIIT